MKTTIFQFEKVKFSSLHIEMDISSVDVLLDLPGGVVAEILASWIPIETLAKLDSAYCNKTQRRAFLQLLDSNIVLFHGITTVWRGTLEWAAQKRLRITNFALWGIGQVIPCTPYYQFLELNGKRLRTLHVHSFSRDTLLAALTDISFSCPNLERLFFRECDVNGCLRGVLTGCTKLKEISFVDGATIDDAGIMMMVYPALTRLTMDKCASDDAFAAFTKAFPNLMEICMESGTVSDGTIATVADHCPKLFRIIIALLIKLSRLLQRSALG